MRIRATFLAGLAVGLVVGARAGRERYDQLKGYTQKVANSPTVRNTTKTVGQKAGELTKAAGQKTAEQLPKLTESAKTSAGKAKASAGKAKASAGKVRSQLTRNHDSSRAEADEADHATVNGSRPAQA